MSSKSTRENPSKGSSGQSKHTEIYEENIMIPMRQFICLHINFAQTILNKTNKTKLHVLIGKKVEKVMRAQMLLVGNDESKYEGKPLQKKTCVLALSRAL